jgi:hypothetical protein
VGGRETIDRQDGSDATPIAFTSIQQAAVNLRRKGRTALLNRDVEPGPVPSITPRPAATAEEAPPVQPSGVFTMILVRTLEEKLSPDEFGELLRRAGENRSVAEFKQTAASASIDQFTRLRHEANSVLGLGPSRPR